jgi:hypothetical protein
VGYSETGLLARTVITYPDDLDLDREPLRRLLTGESAGFDVKGATSVKPETRFGRGRQ